MTPTLTLFYNCTWNKTVALYRQLMQMWAATDEWIMLRQPVWFFNNINMPYEYR